MGRKKLLLSLSFAAAVAMFFVGCGKEEKTTGQKEIPFVTVQEHKMEDGTIHVQPDSRMSSFISQGKYDNIRKEFCGDNGCSDELKTFNDKVTVSLVVTFSNTMILFQRLDKALSTVCGLLGGSIPQICGSGGGSANLQQTSKISEKQTDIVDTVLNLLGLKREEITTLMTEIATATENYIKISDSKNYVFTITVPFQVKVGNLVDVWFKSGTQIRWDLMNVLGAVSQLVLAGFNVINSHDLVLDIGSILSNANQLLGDLSNDPAGFIVRLPGTLGIDGVPNFLRFKQGGADIWKGIPVNLSKFLGWAGNGFEYMFGNPCRQDDPALVCYKDGKLRFNLDLQKNNKFLGEKATGELALPGGFTAETAQNVVKILKNGGEKFDCSKDDNVIQISEGQDKFDISKIVDTVGSFIAGQITEIQLPNFMKIDVCRFFGAEGTQPKPIRDLLFPHELVQEGGKYKTADAGKFFAIDVEASKNFYLRAITLGNSSGNPIYLSRWTNYGDLIVVTNLFTNPPHSFVPQLPYLWPAIVNFSTGLTTVFVNNITITINVPVGDSPVTVTVDYVIATTNQFGDIKISWKFADFSNFAPLLDSTKYNSGLPENTIGLLVPERWVKGDYVARGDGSRFGKVKDQNGNSLEIEKDYLEPLTSFISLMWHSQYPQDVVSSLTAILDDIGMKFLIYVLLRDPSWNNSTQIDICSVLYVFADSAKLKYEATTDSMKKQAIANIVKATYALQKSRKDNQVWDCPVITITENPFSFAVSQARDWKGGTNQVVNDLLALGLFAIAALGVE